MITNNIYSVEISIRNRRHLAVIATQAKEEICHLLPSFDSLVIAPTISFSD